MEFEEKHYSIDPGRGSKMEGCPYSFYEDGRDVVEYIIPPKGYVFTSFRFEPLPGNQIYDGKLIAEYEKVPIQYRLTSDLMKVLIPVSIITVLSVVGLLAVSIFRDPVPQTPKQPKTVIAAADTTQKTETPSKKKSRKERKAEKKQERTQTQEANPTPEPEKTNETPTIVPTTTVPENQEPVVNKEPEVAPTPEVVQQPSQPVQNPLRCESCCLGYPESVRHQYLLQPHPQKTF